MRPLSASRSRFAARFVAADELEDHVVLAVDVCGGAERAQLVLVVARARGHLGARREPELNGGHADTARRAVHEQPVARDELGLREERVVRGRERLHEAARLLPAQVLRHGQDVLARHDHELRLAAAREQRHHARAVGGLACALEPGHVGHAGRRRVVARALAEIGAVDAGCRARGSARSPSPATGSGRSSISIRPSTTAAARIPSCYEP